MRWVALAGSLIAAAWMFYPMFGGDFWALDDHELVHFLPDGRSRLGIADAVKSLVEKTEVGKVFSSTRFQPTYYILRVRCKGAGNCAVKIPAGRPPAGVA